MIGRIAGFGVIDQFKYQKGARREPCPLLGSRLAQYLPPPAMAAAAPTIVADRGNRAVGADRHEIDLLHRRHDRLLDRDGAIEAVAIAVALIKTLHVHGPVATNALVVDLFHDVIDGLAMVHLLSYVQQPP